MSFGNSGYIGASRSVRSQESLDSYEVPLVMFKKDLIGEFIEEEIEDEKSIEILKKIPVIQWKFVARSIIGRSSYHHTGKFFNKTDHYDLHLVAEKILEIGAEKLKVQYNEHKKFKKEMKDFVKKNYQYGYVKVQEWGGTRKHPRITGYEEQYGIVMNGWLYYDINKKYNIRASKVENHREFDTYKELIEKFPDSELEKNEEDYKELINHLTK